MREIKFRYFDTRCNKMFDYDPYSDCPIMAGDVPECVLLQFTGLLDSKGKEIYEGDILRHHTYGDAWEVEYIPDAAGVVIHGKGGQCPLTKQCRPNIEVIGNIYESPEFLEATK